MTACLRGVFIRTPKTPADLPNIISGLLLFPEQGKVGRDPREIFKVYGHRQGRDPWVLDGEFGGSVTEAKIENEGNSDLKLQPGAGEAGGEDGGLTGAAKCADLLNNYKSANKTLKFNKKA